jgi:hypothetical protein
MLGPVLEGDRTRLEPVVREHLPTVAKWRTDLEATRYLLILQFPASRKQHEDWLEKVEMASGRISGWARCFGTSGRASVPDRALARPHDLEPERGSYAVQTTRRRRSAVAVSDRR